MTFWRALWLVAAVMLFNKICADYARQDVGTINPSGGVNDRFYVRVYK